MRGFAAAWVCGALVGCALFAPQLETPRLSIVNVELERGDLFQQHLKVRMRVQNPNARSLPIRGLSYSLQVGGEELANGVSAQSFIVPAMGEAEFDMNVTANMAGTLVRLLSHGGEQLDYHLIGKVTLSQGLLRSIPFEQRGSFKLR